MMFVTVEVGMKFGSSCQTILKLSFFLPQLDFRLSDGYLPENEPRVLAYRRIGPIRLGTEIAEREAKQAHIRLPTTKKCNFISYF